MAAKFRRRIAAGQNQKAIKALTNDLRQLAGFVRVNAMANQAVVRAVVEHLQIEPQVRELVAKYEAELRASTEAKVDQTTPEELPAEPVDDTKVVTE